MPNRMRSKKEDKMSATFNHTLPNQE